MNHDLVTGRARLQRLLTAVDRDPVSQQISMTAALAQARHLDRVGDINDTRRLAGVLTKILSVMAERDDHDATAQTAGELLAVLSDLADDGDEDMAIGVNASAADVSPQVVEIARAFAQSRRRSCM
ncbi:hypothetical protein [Sphingomonas sp. S-NIH.Pt15_0812]|uniref:hypothetical protein n=1 Tax=Sphingomonas sp. S-NIH.Pt15_0812 TaxID=1920129 RepID=UPI000F7E8FCF|nr:hypothetical protein [Sphingomonas sp. S-NIH.Pt15_0812]RSU53996.1 hypothetical protein BRX43_03180 [Sphingomonas sp. S-NIH.Pt15_0812]